MADYLTQEDYAPEKETSVEKLKRLREEKRTTDPKPPSFLLRLLTIDQIKALIDPNGPQTTRWTISHDVPDDKTLALSKAMLAAMVEYSRSEGKASKEELSQDITKEIFRKTFAWWLPYRVTLDGIVQCVLEVDPENKEILEIGSGRGLAARLLQNEGLKVYATDAEPYPPTNSFCSVETLNHRKALKKYEGVKTLMIGWPPGEREKGERMAVESLYYFTGAQIIYIGEPRGGKTATDTFFNLLDKPWWVLVKRLPVRRWPREVDCVYVYRYRRVREGMENLGKTGNE